tara:strand:+ start:387 stop:593 length:207 start_codon:yes stop_codon:yes gene_type:complete
MNAENEVEEAKNGDQSTDRTEEAKPGAPEKKDETGELRRLCKSLSERVSALEQRVDRHALFHRRAGRK